MGFLDFLFKRSAGERFEPREAVLGMLLATAQADGVILAPEREALDAAMGATGLFGEMSRAEVEALVERVTSLCGDRWERVLPDLAQAVPEELRTRVFSLCAEIALSDGHLSRPEARVLERIRRPMGLPRELADHLLASATSRKIMRREE